MELNDANLQTLTEYLRKTLDPDPAVRRPGNSTHSQNIKFVSDGETRVPLTYFCQYFWYPFFPLSKSIPCSWKVSRVCGGNPELPLTTAYPPGEVPRERDPCLRSCYI